MRKSISIIGAGRFGIFWAEKISKFHDVFIYDIEGEKTTNLSFATSVNLQNALSKDFIFLTIPIREIKDFIQKNSTLINKSSVIVDSSSMKTVVVEWFKNYLPKENQYLFTHPLFGPDSGSKGLKDLSISVLPGKVEYSNFKILIELFEKMELNLLSLTAEEHDYQMAYNLNLIHLLGRTLAGMNISTISLKMNALTNLNQMSHYVVNDSSQLFEDFFRYNPFSKTIVNDLKANLEKVIDKHLKQIL